MTALIISSVVSWIAIIGLFIMLVSLKMDVYDFDNEAMVRDNKQLREITENAKLINVLLGRIIK